MEESKKKNLKNLPSVGVELEMPFTNLASGESYAISPGYFLNLQKIKESRGQQTYAKKLGDLAIAISSDECVSGLDNARNLGESALGPVLPAEGGLNKLHEMAQLELKEVAQALKMEGAGVLNMSNHPLGTIEENYYKKTRVPKPLYDYLNGHRGHSHMQGIDAKAQNSPSTGVSAKNGAMAVNAIMAAGAAFVGLFANSPFEQGKLSGYKESRLTIWPQMFKNSIAKGDLRLLNLPEKPFNNLREYFLWMFAPDTKMFFVVPGNYYKSFDNLAVVEEDPNLLDFLAWPKSKAKVLGGTESIEVSPSIGVFEMHQFAQFGPARFRFQLSPSAELNSLLEVLSGKGDEVEQFFEGNTESCYIEGRDPGANFADQDLLAQAGGQVARSVFISPSALQFGLIANLDETMKFLTKYDWPKLNELRQLAIKDGLLAVGSGGLKLTTFTEKILELASAGLPKEHQWMLDYPTYVLSSGQNGADRFIKLVEGSSAGNLKQKIQEALKKRLALP